MIDIRKGFEKRFNHGDIVYWCNKSGNEYNVKYGRVDEQFSDAVCKDLYLELLENEDYAEIEDELCEWLAAE